MTVYSAAKLVHLTTVVVTFLLFFARGVWLVRGSAYLEKRWVRILPHINDTILLGSAIILCIQIGQYPFQANWLTIKIILLFIYIALGMVAIRPHYRRQTRIAAWLGALLVFVFIIATAVGKNWLM